MTAVSTVVMVREYDEPPPQHVLDEMNLRAASCLEVNDVTRIKSFASLDGKQFICIFEARDLESVRRAVDSAGFVYKHLFAATTY